MKILLFVLYGLIALVGIILITGAALPRQHRVSREIALRRSPPEVYALVRDFASAASWRPNLVRVEMLDPVEERLRFREISKGGSVTYEVVEDVPDRKLLTRIVDRDLGYSGSWTYEFAGAEGGMRLRITEDGEVPNILFRFMSRFVFGHTSTIETYLRALAEISATT